MKRLVTQKSVLKALLELPPKQYRQVVSALLDLLVDQMPHYSKSLTGSPYRRIAVGEYRVIYRVDGDDVIVPLFAKRNDDEVYKFLERKM